MKVLLIKASAQSNFKNYKVKIEYLSQCIYYMAKEIKDNVIVEIIDESIGQRVDYRVNADLVGIFFSTPNALRAYELSTNFQEVGKSVFLGGIHATFRQEEALRYANSIIKGEGEGVITDLINDFKKGKLKKIYQKESLLNLKYDNKTIKYIIDEIKKSRASYIELHYNNVIENKTWAKRLVEVLTPLNINWSITSDISIAEDENLLNLAVKSGLTHLLIDINIPSKKIFEKEDEIKKRIKKLHHYGIIIDSNIIFGLDEYDDTIFNRSLEFVLKLDIDICKPLIQMPFPGTKLFNDLEKEKRILTYDWSLYDGYNVVYKTKSLNEKDIYKGIKIFYKKFNSIKNTKQKKLSELIR